jgi:hypothetical protein
MLLTDLGPFNTKSFFVYHKITFLSSHIYQGEGFGLVNPYPSQYDSTNNDVTGMKIDMMNYTLAAEPLKTHLHHS